MAAAARIWRIAFCAGTGLTIVARNFHQRAGPRRTRYRRLGPADARLRRSENPRQLPNSAAPAGPWDREKEKDLRRAAARIPAPLRARPREQARFDLVNIVLTEPPEIEWIKDAFPVSRTI